MNETERARYIAEAVANEHTDCPDMEAPGMDIEEATEAISALLREARLEEANYIFTIVWDEDGAPLQRDDPPHEILERINQLKQKSKESGA